MKLTAITIAYGGVLLTSWKLQEVDLLLGYTLGVVGIFATTLLLVDYLARKSS